MRNTQSVEVRLELIDLYHDLCYLMYYTTHLYLCIHKCKMSVKMSVFVFCPILSPPVPVTGLLSSISVFKQDKVPVHITGLSPPDSPTCHSPNVMKVSSFCLKVGDERRTVVRDLVALTDLIRVATVLEKGG